MSENRLAEIKARCEAATPGPWDWDVVDDAHMLLGTKGLEAFEGAVLGVRRCEACRKQSPERSPCGWPNRANGDFIAAAREDVPYLLTEVERLRAEVARLEAKSKALRAECSDLWEVIERTKDALRDYDGICLEGAQGAWEILQGALDEEPNNAS